jgi:hypothetical protein
MQIRKKWLHQLKTFLTNILKNIIWHLFVGESHQVVKITVAYWAPPKRTGRQKNGAGGEAKLLRLTQSTT